MTEPASHEFSLDFPYSLGAPACRADFRVQPEDFRVEEDLGFEPSGEGEHLLVHLQKRGDNTGWVAEQLAGYFQLRQVDVGFCGLKDRHAVTSQWFSLHLPGQPAADDESRLHAFLDAVETDLTLLGFGRHNRKLRRGQHRTNVFTLMLRNLSDSSELESRLEAIARQGVPNYFGEQRFGRGGSNLFWAHKWFGEGEQIRNRNRRMMVQSAARSYLFNRVLAARVEDGSWMHALEGIADSDTGPLWGRGRPQVDERLAAQEQVHLEAFASWLNGLEHVGLQQERRALVLTPGDFNWRQEDDSLQLGFSLPPGTFATAVLRELALLNNCSAAPEAEM